MNDQDVDCPIEWGIMMDNGGVEFSHETTCSTTLTQTTTVSGSFLVIIHAGEENYGYMGKTPVNATQTS